MPHDDKTRIISQLLGSRDIAPEVDDSSIEELDEELRELGLDVNKVNANIKEFKSRMEGMLAMKAASDARQAAEKEAKIINYPENDEDLDEALRVAEDRLSSASYGMAARKNKDLDEKDKRELLRTYLEMLNENDLGH